MRTDIKAATKADAITAEIIRNSVVAITDEMKTNLMRTAYNMIIYEALDFTVGLFDAAGNTISIGLGLPMFIRGLSDSIKAKLAYYGPNGIEPGDIIHAVNRTAVTTLEELKAELAKYRVLEPVVVQIERRGQLRFIYFEIE